MTIYLIAIAIAIIGGLFIKSKFKRKYGIYYNSLMAVIVILISGLRHFTVGHDTLQFYQAFSVLGRTPWSNLSLTTRYEWGYKIINKLLHIISSDPQILLFVTSTFIVISFSFFIYRYSNGYILSWVIYLTWIFPNNVNLLRQSIAVSILLLGTSIMLKKKYFQYVVVAVFAALFHISAVFAAVIPFILRIKNRLIAVMAFVVTMCLGMVIINIPQVQEVRSYSNYFSSSKYGTADLFGNLYKLMIAIVVLVFLYVCLRKGSDDKKIMVTKKGERIQMFSNDDLIFINIVWVMIGILAININIFDRLFLYFEYFMLISLPRACSNLAKKDRTLMVPFIIIMFVVMFILAVRFTNYAGVSPYRFFGQ